MSRKVLFIVAAVVLVAGFIVAALVYNTASIGRQGAAAVAHPEVFTRDHGPVLGNAEAKVLIVEFLDPACGTCAQFYPLVKRLMAGYPGKVRLSVRHLPLHAGSEEVVLALVASRKQGRYWQTLEALFAAQDRWVSNHVASIDSAWGVMAASGLNMEQLRADMNDPEVVRRVALDKADAQALGVKQTPEYFVDGHPLLKFGFDQLSDLVEQAVKAAY